MSSLHSTTILLPEYTDQSSSVIIDELRYAQEKAYGWWSIRGVWICLWYRYNRWENALANLFFLPPLICITNSFYNFLGTDWYFILHSTEDIYCTSKTEYRISLTEDALKNSTELCKNVKRVLEVIVGLLKDRVTASEEPASKKRRVEEIIKKK